jgi:hypothetical protein
LKNATNSEISRALGVLKALKRASGYGLPKQAPYQLGYTRKYAVQKPPCYYTTGAAVLSIIPAADLLPKITDLQR